MTKAVLSSDPSEDDEARVVAQARDDPDAFAALYRRHVEVIYAFVFRRTRDRELAEDITANTFERALRGLTRFEYRGPGSVSAWLHRIAGNLLVDHYRRAARAPTLDPVQDGATGDDADIERVRRALGRIRPRYQMVIQLRFFAGLETEAAAAAMGCSKSTLAVVQHRAVQALAQAMETP